jgi:predicted thioesterase
MSIQIPENLSLQKEFQVEEQHLANVLGSGSVEVLSTPSMILFMENTSKLMVEPYLPKDFTTVGTEVCIKHLAATPKFSKILVKSMLKKQIKKKLIFHIEVWCNELKIGEGSHQRVIINFEKFMEKMDKILVS